MAHLKCHALPGRPRCTQAGPCRREGFSLVELLVVIAIIGITVGLVLAGVMQARAAAARVECASRLREIGLALHSYHDSQGTLPPGVSYLGGKSPQPFMGWHTRLLPFLEQDALWRQALAAYQADRWFQDNPPHAGLGTVVRIYTCPADARTQDAVRVRSLVLACTDYLGVSGTNSVREDGVLFRDSHVRFADITDGLSNTLMVGERPPSADFVWGWWYAGEGQASDGSTDMLLGVRERNFAYAPGCPLGPYHFQPGRDSNQCDTFHFWSHHPGGAHFLLADGSVSFFPYSRDPALPALATRSGGEVVAASE